ncbi:MAG: ROK family protein [Lachnospiraceae bacterium]|nr:ROK family protein [Lachnospiraceae bacterium]
MDGLKHTQTERRRLTRNRIYTYIFQAKKPVSKQQIADELNISLPTIHQDISELMKAGLIKVGNMLHSTGGRPPVGYAADSGIRFSVGISVGRKGIEFFAADLRQKQLAYKQLTVENLPYEDLGAFLAGELECFFDENALDRERLLGVGVALPGVIDRESDRVLLSPTLRSESIHLSTIRESIPYPVYIENVTTSAGSAEQYSAIEAGETPKSFVYLSLEYGVGGAVFINGSPYAGEHARSAEFGHMCVEPGGRKCNCGKKGCLEAYCSILRITDQLSVSEETFFDALKNGTNPEYSAIWLDLLHHLSIGIHNIRMAFDCDIILGGRMTDYLKNYLTNLKGMVSDLDPFDKDVSYLKEARCGGNAALKGVSWYFTKKFIEEI